MSHFPQGEETRGGLRTNVDGYGLMVEIGPKASGQVSPEQFW